jgi:hypothetical protein
VEKGYRAKTGNCKKHEGTSIASTYNIILSVVAILAMMLFVKKKA